MLGSLDRLAALPGTTQVCGGHEYTETNGQFAATIEPQNLQLLERLRKVATLRAQGKPTLPISLNAERATNPFLRVDNEAIAEWCRQHDAADDRVGRFAALRSAKDAFR